MTSFTLIYILYSSVTCEQGSLLSTSLPPSQVYNTNSSTQLPPPWQFLINPPKLNVYAPAMTILLPRVARTRWIPQHVLLIPRGAILRSRSQMNPFSCSCGSRREHGEQDKKDTKSDPRINNLGRAIEDDFATIRETYGTAPHPFS